LIRMLLDEGSPQVRNHIAGSTIICDGSIRSSQQFEKTNPFRQFVSQNYCKLLKKKFIRPIGFVS
jgi:2-keto-4-pentenoate hydratase/2-oxohepta-3-ene-1,7-dioic acid hydratase in catechol pathway